MVATVHESKVGTYHPNPGESVAWTINDTRGYMDGGPACDICGACECFPCEGHQYAPSCACTRCSEAIGHGEPAEIECIGLAFAFICLDGGESYCEECAEKQGIEIVPCDCP